MFQFLNRASNSSFTIRRRHWDGKGSDGFLMAGRKHFATRSRAANQDSQYFSKIG